jgi:hypothetical protein
MLAHRKDNANVEETDFIVFLSIGMASWWTFLQSPVDFTEQ